jgi:hypothetical protein
VSDIAVSSHPPGQRNGSDNFLNFHFEMVVATEVLVECRYKYRTEELLY